MKALALLGGGGLMVWAVYAALCVAVVTPQYTAPVVVEVAAQPVPPQPTVAIPPPNVLTLDWLEEGEVVPMAEFAPVTEQTLGPKAGDTIYIPEVGHVVCGAHAEERHGEEAIQARHHFASGGGNWQDCKDGRKRGYKPIAKGYTAMMVVEGNGEVSAFISNRTLSAIERVLQRDGCLPPGDPFSGAAVAQ